MTQLTTLQLDLLNKIAKAADGGISTASGGKKTIAALIKRGLITAVAGDGDAGDLQITPAGRAAIGSDESPPAEAPPPAAAPNGKIGVLVGLLRRPEGATIEELMSATGWQAHSVRGAMSGALKKQRGLIATSHKTDGARIYRLGGEAAA